MMENRKSDNADEQEISREDVFEDIEKLDQFLGSGFLTVNKVESIILGESFSDKQEGVILRAYYKHQQDPIEISEDGYIDADVIEVCEQLRLGVKKLAKEIDGDIEDAENLLAVYRKLGGLLREYNDTHQDFMVKYWNYFNPNHY